MNHFIDLNQEALEKYVLSSCILRATRSILGQELDVRRVLYTRVSRNVSNDRSGESRWLGSCV